MTRFGFFYDVDYTVTEEYQQMPLFRAFRDKIKRVHGIDYEDYFTTFCNETDPGIGSMEQLIIDRHEVFTGITNKDFEEVYGPQVQLSPGVRTWFTRMNEFVYDWGHVPEHHAISAGCEAFIKGMPIGKEFASINAGIFIDNEYGLERTKSVVEQRNKSDIIKEICKGEDLHATIGINDYHINYENALVFGDGETDRRMFSFIKQMGGFSICVYKDGVRGGLDEAIKLQDDVNLIIPRDYSEHGKLEQEVQYLVTKSIMKTCDYRYDLVDGLLHNHIKNAELKQLTQRHLDSCQDCQFRSQPTKIY